MNDERVLHSTNGLISNWYVIGNTYSKAIGIKTGSTGEAGRCVAAAAVDEEGRTFYTVILGCEAGDTEEANRFAEASRLLEWGFDKLLPHHPAGRGHGECDPGGGRHPVR